MIPFDKQIIAIGLPSPTTEYRFCERLWRFDYAWLNERLAIEINGGVYTQGRHTRGKGAEGDYVKLNEAALLGWTVLQFSTGQVKSGLALQTIERWFKNRATEAALKRHP